MVSLSQTEADALTTLRLFILSILPIGTECVQGQDNRVPEPLGPDFVMLTPTLRGRLSTNVSTYQDVPGAGTRRVLAATQMTVQIDVHGPAAAETIQVITTLLRDPAACDAFRRAGIDAQPLYAGDPRQAPFINGEGQVETRWTADAVLQVNPTASVPQDFAATLRTDTRIADQGSILHVGTTLAPIGTAQRGTSFASPHGANSYAETVIANGIASVLIIRHPLNSTDVTIVVQDPSDGNVEIPGLDKRAPTPGTVEIEFGAPPPANTPFRVLIERI